MAAETDKLVAAIDMGSNSFHFCVAREVKQQIQQVYSFKQRVRLAQGIDEHGNLSEDAIERGLQCLAQFADKLSQLNVSEVRAVATFALRQAPNRAQFLTPANRLLPTPVEVVAGVEEARLIYQGVRLEQPITNNSLIIDIGGGSTEVILAGAKTPKMLHSEAMGCVSFQQIYFSEAITKRQFKKAKLRAQRQLHGIAAQYKRNGWQSTIGTSGTVKAIMNLCLGQASDASRLTDAHLKKLQQQVIDNPTKLLEQGLDEQRLKVLPGGLAILRGVFAVFDIDSMSFSRGALREGVISEMLHSKPIASVANQTINSISKLYHVDIAHADNVCRSLSMLIAHYELTPQQRNLVLWAAQLHEIGLQMNAKGFQRHGHYILSQSNLPGFTIEQQQVLAWLVLNHRKNLKSMQPLAVEIASSTQLINALVALRIACLLHLGHSNQSVDARLHVDANSFQLHIGLETLGNDLLQSELEREQDYLAAAGIKLEII
ncbi:Ppx/GppA phosphatase family protein [Paraferrimonas haliotis]|uniref:Exopolyphosphatase n=1 Tax=Paraferrimonas haliotis TaxID=2013866 RepID=A0AA37TNY5_9GAMM|nr:Ppx/GppA phosphatase family protein [Paraferrimonas haliotis]GLS82950.1 exopolyphosphatase [Paraferrimonas haliotis]